MVSKNTLTILVSIILTIILISIVNVGIKIIIGGPEYSDYCKTDFYRYDRINITDEEINAQNLKMNECNEAYQNAQSQHNQYRYYILAALGFAFLLTGLFAKENLIQITGLSSGGILVAQGVIINLENEILVFLSLLAILAIFGKLAYNIINKKK